MIDTDILIVDDSGMIRKILSRVICHTGLSIGTIHQAGDGIEALEILTVHRVGLVITDINMPKMDGLQLLAAIKASADLKNIPVVVMISESTSHKVTEATRLGAAGYVFKPFTAEDLNTKLAGIFNPEQ